MRTKPLRTFDMRTLCSALDAERQRRNLTWAELTDEINTPFRGTPSIPISTSTLRGMSAKRSVTSGVVLQILRWLDRTPESFLAGQAPEATESAKLPGGPGRILRFDTRAMHAALDSMRQERGLSWREMATQLPGFTDGMLRNLASGPLIGFPRVMLIPQFLGTPAATFVRECPR